LGECLALGDLRLPVPAMAAGLLAKGEEVLLGSRPEYTELSVEERPDSLPGVVAVVENLGAAALISVEIADLMVQAVVPEGEEPRVGERVWIRPQNTRALVYRGPDGMLVANPLQQQQQPAADPRTEPVTA
jgi:multiple sugar transport system ATP-binding protein